MLGICKDNQKNRQVRKGIGEDSPKTEANHHHFYNQFLCTK